MKLFNSRPDHKRSLGEPFSGVDGSLAGEQSEPRPSHPLVTGPKERIGRRALVVWHGGSGVSFKSLERFYTGNDMLHQEGILQARAKQPHPSSRLDSWQG